MLEQMMSCEYLYDTFVVLILFDMGGHDGPPKCF